MLIAYQFLQINVHLRLLWIIFISNYLTFTLEKFEIVISTVISLFADF